MMIKKVKVNSYYIDVIMGKIYDVIEYHYGNKDIQDYVTIIDEFKTKRYFYISEIMDVTMECRNDVIDEILT